MVRTCMHLAVDANVIQSTWVYLFTWFLLFFFHVFLRLARG